MSDIESLDNDESREIRLSMTMENVQIPASSMDDSENEENEE